MLGITRSGPRTRDRLARRLDRLFFARLRRILGVMFPAWTSPSTLLFVVLLGVNLAGAAAVRPVWRSRASQSSSPSTMRAWSRRGSTPCWARNRSKGPMLRCSAPAHAAQLQQAAVAVVPHCGGGGAAADAGHVPGQRAGRGLAARTHEHGAGVCCHTRMSVHAVQDRYFRRLACYRVNQIAGDALDNPCDCQHCRDDSCPQRPAHHAGH